MKLPTGVTVTKNKDVRGKRILSYTVKQGRKEWHGKSEAEALAAREADIAQACEEYHDPIVLESPHPDEPNTVMIAHFALGGWRYGFYRMSPKEGQPHTFYASGIGSGYRTRRECERRMRCHAADIAIRIGPAPEYAILSDGCDYLQDSSCEHEDITNALVKAAYVRGHVIARARGLALGAPGLAGETLCDEYRRAESERLRKLGPWIPGSDAVHYFRTGQIRMWSHK